MCYFGYQLYGRAQGSYLQSITCKINTTTGIPYWDGFSDLVDCIPIYCQPPPEISNADIENILYSDPGTLVKFDNSSTYFIDSKVNYSCLVGYRFDYSSELYGIITCKTVVFSTHIAGWDPVNISCVRMLFELAV